MSYSIWIFFSKLLLIHMSEAYRALIISSLPIKSHSILGDSLVKLIADAGNEVTYLTSFSHDKPPPRVKEIAILDENYKKAFSDALSLKAVLNGELSFTNVAKFVKTFTEINSLTLQNNDVQKIINDPNEKFDVIITSWMYSDIYIGLAAIFDCPFIWLSMVAHHWKILRLIGDIPNPAYNADMLSRNHPPFNFLQRVQELRFQISGFLLDDFYVSGLHTEQYENIIAPILRKRGKVVPNFQELRFNASLVLSNSHVSLGSETSLPPNFKPIGGFHVSETLFPLTEDLKKLLDDSKHGVIYFSLGSNLQSGSFPQELTTSLLKMFGGLNQTVLWKFEDELSQKPSNVHVMKWAPQNSILAHKNCILFITHGGQLSMIEAIHFAKPIIGIPVYGDQFQNIAKAVYNGFAKKVDLSYGMVDEIRTAIEEIINNSSYAARARELSLIYFHRPVKPSVEIVHWVDHVIQTGGALHLRSPALLLKWYQKMYLDLVLVTFVIIFGLKLLIMRMCFILCRKKKSKKIKKN